MDEKLNKKQLISAYIDGELTSQEKEQVEELILNDSEAQAYYKELTQLSNVLTSWEDEAPSPDLEVKLNSSLAKVKKEERPTMQLNKRFVMSATSFIVALVVGVFVFQNYYMKRGVQGQLKAAVDNINKQHATGVPASTSQVRMRDASVVMATEASNAGVQATSAPRITPFEEQIKLARIQGATSVGGGLIRKKTESYSLASHEDTRYKRSIGGFQASDYDFPESPSFHTSEINRCGPSKRCIQFPVDPGDQSNTEEYDRIYENEFKLVKDNPLSTFSIDVDTGSYSNMRRFINSGQLPYADAVRIEEMINYFSYDYPKPAGDDPFSITLNASTCPWNTAHQLVRIGLKGKTLDASTLPPSNLVFLIDVSGSMSSANKLPLLKNAFKMLTNQLSANERVAIVVYAGAAGVVLESTPGNAKQDILEAINNLHAGGSTAGGAGIKMAYQIARDNFIKDGNNRVILATDGDFNVGTSSTSELTRLIEEKRKEGIFLTVLGFGAGNLKDGRMEQIANKGNGNYYYIDTQNEAKKVLVQELGSTLFTIAKDVKLQIEFNPNKIKAYRLIGYENRMLAKEDFNDDTKDAGELGAGHTVTALYEIVPADSVEEFRQVDDLVYQKQDVVKSDDLMLVKLRYKKPNEDTSKLIKQAIKESDLTEKPSQDFEFAAAVAEFGLLLRNSKFKENASYEHVLKAAKESQGVDAYGYRAEFITLVEKAKQLDMRVDNSEPGVIHFK